MSSKRKDKREIIKALKKMNKKNVVKLHNKQKEIEKFFASDEGRKYYNDLVRYFVD